jgi:regulator of protease activity HflC (stomatin/prohibitin superfamily)
MKVLVVVLAVAVVAVRMGVHQISEGNVGVYYRGGALLNTISQPGLHVMIPFITSVHEVQVTTQTDAVGNIPCGTSGGVLIYFEKVEVVNRLNKDHVLTTVANFSLNYDQQLIFNRVHSEVNAFCSSHSLQEVYISEFSQMDDVLMRALEEGCQRWAPGLEIIAVRLSKPRIPEEIAQQFVSLEKAKAALLVAEQTQKVVAKEAETERKKALIEAQARKEVSEINQAMKLQEEEVNQKVSKVKNEIFLAQQKATADAASYAAESEAAANAKKLTQPFLDWQRSLAVANNSKILYFGDKLPANMWVGDKAPNN